MCAALTPPQDGSVTYVDTAAPQNQLDSIAEFSCNSNFELVGETSVVCLSDGSWSEQTPQCVGETSAPKTYFAIFRPLKLVRFKLTVAYIMHCFPKKALLKFWISVDIHVQILTMGFCKKNS